MIGKTGKEQGKFYDQRLRRQRFSIVFSGTKNKEYINSMIS